MSDSIQDQKIQDSHILHQGILKMKVSETEMKEGYFVLLYDRLIMCQDAESKIPIGITSIKWKRIDPFSEIDSDGVERFGFKLTGQNHAEDFYAENSEDLDNWLDYINGKAILTEICEDYEFIREVG